LAKQGGTAPAQTPAKAAILKIKALRNTCIFKQGQGWVLAPHPMRRRKEHRTKLGQLIVY
jgi:hypothetical protein